MSMSPQRGPFRMSIALRWSDLDAFNHVNNARYLTFLEQARIEWFESIGEPWVTDEWTSARTFGVAPEDPGERVVATVLFTDIVDSTATMQLIGDSAWHERLTSHNRVLRDALNQYRGREVATTGDGFLAVFDGATRAVRCGVAMARAARELGLAIRVGVHTGEVEFVGSNARGLAVHAAARVMSIAGAGEVLVSSTTRDLLEGSGLQLEDAGTHQLKGLAGPRRLFRVG